MKTFLTILMPLIAIVAGIASFVLFSSSLFYASAVLTVVAFLSASAWVYRITKDIKVAYH